MGDGSGQAKTATCLYPGDVTGSSMIGARNAALRLNVCEAEVDSDLALESQLRQHVHERPKYDQCYFYRHWIDRTSHSYRTSICLLLQKSFSFNLPKALYQLPRAAQLSTKPAAPALPQYS